MTKGVKARVPWYPLLGLPSRSGDQWGHEGLTAVSDQITVCLLPSAFMTTSSFVVLLPAKKAMAGSAGEAAQAVGSASEIMARVKIEVRMARRLVRLSDIGETSVGVGG